MKKRSYGLRMDPKNLPYVGALVQAVLFAFAGNAFFAQYGWVAGLGVGWVVNYSLALASSRIADVAKKRKPLASVALGAMFLLSPTTITLSLFMPHSVFAAIAWSVCVDLSIVLAGAIAGKSFIPEAKLQEAAASRSTKGNGRSTKKHKSERIERIVPCKYEGAGCTRTGSQNAMNAHARSCKFKPTIAMPAEQKYEQENKQ